MVEYKVNDDSYATLVCLGDEGFKVIKCAVIGINVVLVCHVILVICG